MLTGLNITSTHNPFSLPAKPKHRLQTKNIGWSRYIEVHSKPSGPVDDREHAAFLNLWLERFVFCGSTLGPTTNMQRVAEELAQGKQLPLGKFLLGATYPLLHQVSVRLSAGQSVGHFGGPWWFLQLWLNLYTSAALNEPLANRTFPADYAEGEKASRRRCMSCEITAKLFRGFYYGFTKAARI